MLRDPSLIPLSHQHQHALALCVQIERGLAGATAGKGLAELALAVMQHFDSEMRNHFRAEETVLFPLLSDFESTRVLVRSLIDEHRSLEELRNGLGQAPDQHRIAEFAQLLRLHVRKEEGVLFEEAQKLLSREQLAELGERLAAAL